MVRLGFHLTLGLAFPVLDQRILLLAYPTFMTPMLASFASSDSFIFCIIGVSLYINRIWSCVALSESSMFFPSVAVSASLKSSQYFFSISFSLSSTSRCSLAHSFLASSRKRFAVPVSYSFLYLMYVLALMLWPSFSRNSSASFSVSLCMLITLRNGEISANVCACFVTFPANIVLSWYYLYINKKWGYLSVSHAHSGLSS